MPSLGERCGAWWSYVSTASLRKKTVEMIKKEMDDEQAEEPHLLHGDEVPADHTVCEVITLLQP